jgi:hypothetical protein
MTAPATGASAQARGRWSAAARAHCSAPASEVWPLVGEAHRWKEWSFLTQSDLVSPGVPHPEGVGAVRRFTRWGMGSKEQVAVWDPPHHLRNTILSGFPVRDYVADVTLAPDGDGTLITWSSTFDAKVPGTGRLMAAVLRRMINGFASSVARFADQRHVPRPPDH